MNYVTASILIQAPNTATQFNHSFTFIFIHSYIYNVRKGFSSLIVFYVCIRHFEIFKCCCFFLFSFFFVFLFVFCFFECVYIAICGGETKIEKKNSLKKDLRCYRFEKKKSNKNKQKINRLLIEIIIFIFKTLKNIFIFFG